MPSRYPKLQKMLLCNPKLFFYYYKNYKRFPWQKILYISQVSYYIFFFPIYVTKLFTFGDKVSKPPLTKNIPQVGKENQICHICLWDIYTQTHHFGKEVKHFVAHAEQPHCQNMGKKEITIYKPSKWVNKRWNSNKGQF